MSKVDFCHFGVQEPPNDPRIYKGKFSDFFDKIADKTLVIENTNADIIKPMPCSWCPAVNPEICTECHWFDHDSAVCCSAGRE